MPKITDPRGRTVNRQLLIVSTTALVLALGIAAPLAVYAQSGAPATTAPARERPDRIEGRIAFLRAELKITDPQTAQWNALTAVMRANNQAMRATMQRVRDTSGKTITAVERFELREQAASASLDGVRKFLAALRPLYDTMSADQKKLADDLFESTPGGGPGGMGRPGPWRGRDRL